ncbi:transposase [Saccharopolyspora soli]|uniref:transposase n=1 Tax=Saccharopolyspora soli TaxID=2926618 RepID=UPI003556C107
MLDGCWCVAYVRASKLIKRKGLGMARRYDAEIRVRSVRMVRELERAARVQVARDLDVSERTLANWVVRDRGSVRSGGLNPGERAELVRLRRERDQLVSDRDALARALTLCAGGALTVRASAG